jgi:hypothetical protein
MIHTYTYIQPANSEAAGFMTVSCTTEDKCDGIFSIGDNALYLDLLLGSNTSGGSVLTSNVLSAMVTCTVGEHFPKDPKLVTGISFKETALDSVFDMEFEVNYATQGWLPFATAY